MPSGAEEKAEKGTSEFDFSAIVPGLLNWYDRNARILPWREDSSPYRVWISEIMLQQTRVEAAKPYFERFLAALPDLASLASAPEELLLKLWEGLGYYSRVRNLARCARIIQAEYGGHFPGSAEELRRLPGIGEYTAGAIASISFGLPEPAVDGNVLRVAARLTGYPGEVTQPRFRKEITGKLRAVYPAGRCGDFTQSLMELGAVVCLPNGAPKCSCCPLAKGGGPERRRRFRCGRRRSRAGSSGAVCFCCVAESAWRSGSARRRGCSPDCGSSRRWRGSSKCPVWRSWGSRLRHRLNGWLPPGISSPIWSGRCRGIWPNSPNRSKGMNG